MTKGTPSFGLHNKAPSHRPCRRCGSHSFHKAKQICSSCGYGATAKLRKYNWMNKTRTANGFKAHNIRSSNYKKRHQLHRNIGKIKV